ncbi:hypothetical protein [Mucisphaera calidilacus]|uniref:S-adenosylmethionine decarboxylase n=1 Tax=Mucisphaera calidilacus TaxID=2527982 RepID=A0A518C0X2_9BACT|nr:hypothetical protein [Mucisphaera calidilacus]QDU72875.1 hypothetical protein Pan265_27510 [Mucisphaera calidilacus]
MEGCVLQEQVRLMVRAEVGCPPVHVETTAAWMAALADRLGLEGLLPPRCRYTEDPGHRGMSCVAALERSQVSLHCWDEMDPAVMQLDVHAAGVIDVDVVVEAMSVFEPRRVLIRCEGQVEGARSVREEIVFEPKRRGESL